MNHTDYEVAIIGGGPAGLTAAARASARGRKTVLIDKNREPGVKILISGGTRCNLTHDTDARGIVEAFGQNGKFLFSALAALNPRQVVDLFNAEGVPTKVEPGGKVFPASDRAADVRAVLERLAIRGGCELAMGETLLEIAKNDDFFTLTTARRSISAKKLILATGGQSYPACGTTGDGYRWSAALGHRIVPPRPALVPITSHADWVLALQGITLADVSAKVIGENGVPLASSRGSLLFAHFGVTGPVVLDVSHAASSPLAHPDREAEGESKPQTAKLLLRCDLAPDATADEIFNDFNAPGKRRAGVSLDSRLPHRVGQTIVELAGVSADRPIAEVSKTDRRTIATMVKRLDIPIAGTMGFRKAEATAGGVALDQVDSRTMESKLVPGLFFAGELLDLNGPVGGYNFQAAFSTGRLAGENV